ncbi:MAG: hypothetical protein EBS56_03455, partial [Planctomycetia bacterium]|nr:hypothetical protein [Planctomycetia bacterium]
MAATLTSPLRRPRRSQICIGLTCVTLTCIGAAGCAPVTAPARAQVVEVEAIDPAPSAAPAQPAAREKVMLGEPSLTAGVPGSGPITLAEIDAWLA